MPRFFNHGLALTILAAPVAIQNLAFAAVMFTDTVMVGHIGLVALGAVGLAHWLIAPLSGVVQGIALAMRPIVAQQCGAGQQRDVGQWTQQAIWLGQVVAWLCVILYWLAKPLLVLLPIDDRLTSNFVIYLDVLIWSIPAISAYFTLRFVSHGISHTRIDVVMAAVAFLINLFGNWCLMYGKLGFPELGLIGCAWSTTITFWALLISTVIYMQLKQSVYSQFQLNYRVLLPAMPNCAISKEIMRLGIPISAGGMLGVGLFTIVGIISAIVGAEVSALHQILKSINSLLAQLWKSIRAATCVMVAQSMGARDAIEARYKGNCSVLYTKIMLLVLGSAIVAMWQPLISVFSQQGEALETLLSVWGVFVLYLFFDGLHLVSLGVVRGYKDARTPFYMNMLAYYGFALPMICVGVFTYGFGLRWIWFSLAMMMALYSGLLFTRFWFISGHAIRRQDADIMPGQLQTV
ncbi:MAG: MATE family efflux transporter [Gammaproteobacteria bacterium]|nr:MATE family efflux transporter [Gammaproteobacteria bacterium]